MKSQKVLDFMVSLSDYATVYENDNLSDAIKALKSAQENYIKKSNKHRAILVYNNEGVITGKVSAFDILRSLEPKYSQFGETNKDSIGLSRFGHNKKFLSSLFDQYNLWEESLSDLVKKASILKIKDIMYTPAEGEFVNEYTPIAEAIHQFILGHHQSLLVLKANKIVGILRLSDMFEEICNLITE